MLTENEIREIQEILEKANNPIYLFDDDGDGVCAYLLLKKFYKKGRGMPIKVAGPLTTFYVETIEREKADLVVVLDKAVVMQEFIDSVPCPIIYIDHHPLQKLSRVHYFNPLIHDKNSYIPTSQICFQITKSNMWISMVGCLFDYKVPDFIKEFKKQYPDLIDKITRDAGYYKYQSKSKIGKLIKVFSFNLKGKNEDVKKAIRHLENVESPYEVLNQTTEHGEQLYKRYERLNKNYEELLNKAKECLDKSKFLIFNYSAQAATFSTDLSTELSCLFPDKTIIVIREKHGEMKLSVRNQKKAIKNAHIKALEGLGGYGGGHPHAVGGAVPKQNFEIYLERIKKLIK